MNTLFKSIRPNQCGSLYSVFSRTLRTDPPKMIESSDTSFPIDINEAPIESSIRKKITEQLSPSHLEIVNESYMHNTPDSETHFKLLIVSTAFKNKSPIERHRMIYDLLDEELRHGVHALSINAKTPEQWTAGQEGLSPSPKCRGGFGR